MRLWLFFEVPKNLDKICFARMKTSFRTLCFSLQLIKVSRNSHTNLPIFLPDFLGLGCWCFWMSSPHVFSWESRSSWFYRLHSASFDFWGLFGKGFEKAQTSLISRQTWALLWSVILATRTFGKNCLIKLQNGCCLATAEGLTKVGLLWLSEGFFH